MAIPRDFIDNLISTSNVVDIVSEYVSLKKNGRNYTGLCPFHSEKTPSFVVSSDKQIYHCFGCGKGGNSIGFVMDIEGLGYVDAIKFLAEKYRLTVPEDKNSSGNNIIRQRILEINKFSARFFYENLLTPENKFVRDYLAERKITKKTATTFGIGYASNRFDALINHLKKQGYTLEEMLQAGVVSKNDKGNIFDKFRGRVMFPIIDIRNNIIGFGGRVLDDSIPKYLNSPETIVFNKSSNLFGLNLAKKTKQDYMILAEGYMDVIALHKAGFDSAIASLGTSLTDGQARLLLRYTKNVIIAYDGDTAGKNATNRAIEILKKVDFNVRVLQMKDAKDPDEFIIKYGVEAFAKLIHQSEHDNDYKFNEIIAKYNLNDDTQKLSCIKELIRMMANIYSSVEKELYINKTAEFTSFSTESIKNELKLFEKNKKKKEIKQNYTSPIKSVLPKVKSIHYTDIKSAKAEEEIIRLIFTDCNLIGIINIDITRFSVEPLQKVYLIAKKLYEQNIQIQSMHLYEVLTPDEISYVIGLLSTDLVAQDKERAILDDIKIINERYAIRSGNVDLLQKLRST